MSTEPKTNRYAAEGCECDMAEAPNRRCTSDIIRCRGRATWRWENNLPVLGQTKSQHEEKLRMAMERAQNEPMKILLGDCPWCAENGDPIIVDTAAANAEPDAGTTEAAVRCANCGALGPSATAGCHEHEDDADLPEEVALSRAACVAWNERAPDDRAARIAELEECLARAERKIERLSRRVPDLGATISYYYELVVSGVAIIENTDKEINALRASLLADLDRTDRDAIYKHDLRALVGFGSSASCHTHLGTLLVQRLAADENPSSEVMQLRAALAPFAAVAAQLEGDKDHRFEGGFRDPPLLVSDFRRAKAVLTLAEAES